MSEFITKGRINEGQRPGLLQLGRQLTGELEGEVPEPYRAAVEQSRAMLPPLDLAALRARADEEEERLAEVIPLRRWPRILAAAIPLLAAAIALVALLSGHDPRDRIKGEDELSWYRLHGEQVLSGDGEVRLAAGDRLQFEVFSGRSSLVLLSVDGRGEISWYLPEGPDGEAATVEPGRTTLLDFSIELDDAPGPEVFVAFFDADPRVAEDRVRSAWALGGREGLMALSREPGVDAVIVHKED